MTILCVSRSVLSQHNGNRNKNRLLFVGSLHSFFTHLRLFSLLSDNYNIYYYVIFDYARIYAIYAVDVLQRANRKQKERWSANEIERDTQKWNLYVCIAMKNKKYEFRVLFILLIWFISCSRSLAPLCLYDICLMLCAELARAYIICYKIV